MEHRIPATDQLSAAKVVETISTLDIIASWRKDFGIDVARLFEGVETLLMLEDTQTGQLSFYPPIEGDAAFYQALRKFDWYHPPTKEEFSAAAKYHIAGEQVIDVGAGAGGFAAHVPRGLYCGLETDGEATLAGVANGLNIIKADMSDYLESANFQAAGLVTAFQVLEHVAAPQAFIKKLSSLACAGGRVAIGVPDAGSYVADLPDFMLNAPPHHLTWWTQPALASAMEVAGLKIIGTHCFAVEPWERQLWWMAKLANLARPAGIGRFGATLRARKVASFLGSWVLQLTPIPTEQRGSTLLMVGEKRS